VAPSVTISTRPTDGKTPPRCNRPGRTAFGGVKKKRPSLAQASNIKKLACTCREINSSRLVLDLTKSRACPLHLPLRCVRLKNKVNRWRRLVLVLCWPMYPLSEALFLLRRAPGSELAKGPFRTVSELPSLIERFPTLGIIRESPAPMNLTAQRVS
jgi:hypothetical protein